MDKIMDKLMDKFEIIKALRDLGATRIQIDGFGIVEFGPSPTSAAPKPLHPPTQPDSRQELLEALTNV